MKKLRGLTNTPIVSQRGDIALYVAVVIIGLMLASAMGMALIIVQQIKASKDVVASERAFYAASTAQEEALYRFGHDPYPETLNILGDIPYETLPGQRGSATYISEQAVRYPDGSVCIRTVGSFNGKERRLARGGNAC